MLSLQVLASMFHYFFNSALSTSSFIVIGALAVCSHRFYFIRGEHHRKAFFYLKLWVLLSISVASTIFVLNNYELYYRNTSSQSTIIGAVLIVNCAFFGPLFGSIIIYRLFEHPLRRFDGPRLAAISKLWHFLHLFSTSNHLFLDDLQHRYGHFVRTGT